MSQVSKHVFAGEELEIVTIVDNQGEKWFLANPFVRILGYANINKVVKNHVSVKNQQEYSVIQGARGGHLTISISIHPQSKFINQAGIFELIHASKMPKAKEFQNWINADLLPKLCNEGEYSMQKNATRNIQQAMNVVHQVSNDGASASWMDNDKIQVLRLKLELSEMKGEMMQQKLEFQERENKYQHVIKDLTRQANMTLTEFGVQGLLARDNIADNDQLRDNLRRVKDRVIPELSERPEKEQYATCYEYEKKGAKRIRVTRNQLAEIERRDKIMEQRRENPTKKFSTNVMNG
nr:hypothetical protein [Microctonus hyperodae filamentous virus]